MNISLLGVFRRDLVCQQVVEMVTAYLEDGLSRSDRRRLDKHLAGCPLCTEYLAQIRETIRLAGARPGGPVGGDALGPDRGLPPLAR